MPNNKKLKIAIVSKLWEETSPFSKGGTGSSLGFLVNGLVDNGHRVTLFATANSKTKAQELISVRKKPYKGDYSENHEFENISNAFKDANKFDIIHCGVEHKSVFFGNLSKTPSLHSIRYGEFFDQEIELLKKYSHLNYVSNSYAIKNLFPFLNWQGVVYNGIDYNQFKVSKKAGDYLLFLARLTPQKGIDTAISIAKSLKMKLVIAGKMSETDKLFLEKKVLPFIDNKQIIYLGEVLGRKKINLLKNAYCLIQPNKIFEACSNSILEAMASAVPVVTYNKGSNNELVKDNKTGFLVNNEAEMAKAVLKVKNLKKSDCLLRVKKYFSLKKMVSNYERIYYKLINKN